jgi:ubiquinone/menaquinone biosynthesis C-methylase UbiE
MEQRLYFDTVAQLYDSARPGYPPLLIEDLIQLSGIGPPASVLDVGCGTGKSTEPFAKLGFKVCALDPGASMLAVCKERLRQYANVTYENTDFETWQNGGHQFDLVVSGTAFHWVAEAGYRQLLQVLKPEGSVGIFWHTFLNGHDSFYDRLDAIYHDHAPELYVTDLHARAELAERAKEERLLAWDGFVDWRVVRYYDSVRYDADGYRDLLRTWPDHATLSERFYSEVASAIRDAGGYVVKPIRTTLVFGRRRV